jgi:hypothetical protein
MREERKNKDPRFGYANVVQYSLIVARDDYGVSFWNEMFAAGHKWHTAIVEALAAMPRLTSEELTLLLQLTDAVGFAVQPEVRIASRDVIARRFSFYDAPQQSAIVAHICSRWGFKEQVAFIEAHPELLDVEEWQSVLRHNAEDYSSLGHDALASYLRGNHTTLMASHPRLFGSIVELLKESAIPWVADWASALSKDRS